MRRVLFAVLATVAGLVGLMSFKTREASTAAPLASSTTGTSGASSSGGSTAGGSATGGSASRGSGSSTTTPAAGASSSSSAASKTASYTGSIVNTQYGPIEVRITVRGGSVVAATAVESPGNDPRSQQINAYALPILEKETVGKTSASSVDAVSGATYTSNGYLQSLQSALDKAGL